MQTPAASSAALFDPTDLQSGKKLIDGASIATLLQWTFTSQYGLTALSGGGQAGAPVINAGVVEIDTVAAGADSISLPFAVAGLSSRVFNQAATNSLTVWPQPGVNPATGIADVFLNAAGATIASQALAAKASVIYFALKPGVWKSTS